MGGDDAGGRPNIPSNTGQPGGKQVGQQMTHLVSAAEEDTETLDADRFIQTQKPH